MAGGDLEVYERDERDVPENKFGWRRLARVNPYAEPPVSKTEKKISFFENAAGLRWRR